MTERPISCREADVRAIRDGVRDRLWLPVMTMNSHWRTGDRLWLREPFHLSSRWDAHTPVDAWILGAPVAHFAADRKCARDDIGRKRRAREMPFGLHRMHLLVTAIDRRRLHDITAEEMAGQGFAAKADFVRHWRASFNCGRTVTGDFVAWEANPSVLQLCFQPVREALTRPHRRTIAGAATP